MSDPPWLHVPLAACQLPDEQDTITDFDIPMSNAIVAPD
jgi:hypothetical protein